MTGDDVGAGNGKHGDAPEAGVGPEWLWDGSGEADAESARIEELLGRYRYRPVPPAGALAEALLTPRSPRVRRLILAAAVAVIGLLAWQDWRGQVPPAKGVRVRGLPGAETLELGTWLDVPEGRRARLEIEDVGTVDLEGGSRLRLDASDADRQHLFLAEGALEAFVTSAPRVFQIATPAALAIDLGCAYRLEVDAGGRARILVTLGQVAFEGAGRTVYVPTRARCLALPDGGPTAPAWAADGIELCDAVAALDRAEAPGEEEIAEVLARVDSLSLWHLLDARSEAVRAAALARLAELAPPPPGVELARVGAGDAEAREAWLRALPWFGEFR